MDMTIILGAIGGLALFLYGMNLMGDGLQKVAGNKLKSILQSLTRNRIMAVLVGTFVTMIIQSSSATTVMLVGFVNAGLMTLQQSAGVILGANIGTTITGQMVSLNLTEIAPLVVAIGILMKSFSHKKSGKDAADILIGFGILFIGMNLLKDSLSPLKDSPAFANWISEYGQNPLIGVGIGILMTMVLQSSSVTIGVLIALALNGVMPITTAVYIIFGDNIGTCTTAVLGSLSASRRGKRVAALHLLFKIVGTIYFVLFLVPYLLDIVIALNPDDIGRQIANAHTIFNLVNFAVLVPFINFFVKLVYKLLPETPEERAEKQNKQSYLDKLLLKTPAFALKNAMYEFIVMATHAQKTMDYAIDAVEHKNMASVEKAFKHEQIVNEYEKNLVEYLVKLTQQENISSEELMTIDYLFNTVHNVERISDHSENIAEYVQNVIDRNIIIDDKTNKELEHVYNLIRTGFNYSIDALSTGNITKVKDIIQIEKEVDQLKVDIRNNYIRRMNRGIVTAESGLFVMDLLSNLERISDHFRNIAETVELIGKNI